MNFTLATCLLATMAGVGVAALSLGFGSAPGWRHYRVFALVAVSAAFFCGSLGLLSVSLPDAATRVVMHLQGTAGAIHVAAWHAYARQHLGTPPSRSHRGLLGALYALALLWLVPGLMFHPSVVTIPLPWLGVTYRLAVATPLGAMAFALEVALLGLAMRYYWLAWRAGAADTSMCVAALAAIFVTGFHDALVATQLIASPLMLPLGFLVSVGASGWLLMRMFVRSATELERLSRRLEHEVEARTGELVSTEAALVRAEKMAALGQLSAAVAHEINNPAAVVSANITYLRDELARGAVPGDAIECLDDSLESVSRIALIVRQLLDSGRAAATAPNSSGSSSVLRAAQKAIGLARPGVPAFVTTFIDVDAGIFVHSEESSLVQVLVNLVVNGAQAIPSDRRGGRVEIRAVCTPDRVEIEVRDNGSGMTEETKRRLFEPFFTTKPIGKGTGLGLSVSMGLVRSMGGQLRVESTLRGTSMTIELGRSESASPPSVPGLPVARPGRSLLLVDDDVAVGRAVARTLAASFDVHVVGGVAEALERLAVRSFDMILSDVQMPGGGGRRLCEELASSTEVVRRLVLFSGGDPSDEDRTFFAERGVPLLGKPLVLDALFEVINRTSAARGDA